MVGHAMYCPNSVSAVFEACALLFEFNSWLVDLVERCSFPGEQGTSFSL